MERQINQWNSIESPEMNPNEHSTNLSQRSKDNSGKMIVILTKTNNALKIEHSHVKKRNKYIQRPYTFHKN